MCACSRPDPGAGRHLCKAVALMIGTVVTGLDRVCHGLAAGLGAFSEGIWGVQHLTPWCLSVLGPSQFHYGMSPQGLLPMEPSTRTSGRPMVSLDRGVCLCDGHA